MATGDLFEPNDTVEQATYLALDTYVKGIALDRVDDVDWFKIDVPSAGGLAIELVSLPTDLQVRAELYSGSDMTNAILTRDYIRDSALISAKVSPGTYYLKLIPQGNNYSATSFIIKASVISSSSGCQ